jgi:hypothetical protein
LVVFDGVAIGGRWGLSLGEDLFPVVREFGGVVYVQDIEFIDSLGFRVFSSKGINLVFHFVSLLFTYLGHKVDHGVIGNFTPWRVLQMLPCEPIYMKYSLYLG